MARYAEQLSRYFSLFSKENIHIIIFDDLKDDTERVVRKVCSFLEVDSFFSAQPVFANESRRVRFPKLARLLLTPPGAVHTLVRRVLPRTLRHSFYGQAKSFLVKSQRPLAMSPCLRKQLQTEFLPQVEHLSELLGRDLTHWCRL
jgi:hypothetical protein